MRIRLRTQWNNQERDISLEDTVSVLAFNSWRIGMQSLLEIENENFQVDTQMQRIAVLEEMMAFLIHLLDRIAYNSVMASDREALISAFALKLADHVHNNAQDFAAGDHRNDFINKLNTRLADYSETTWATIAQEPGFSMGLAFGNHIANALGSRDNKWALDYIQQVLMPEMVKLFKQVLTRIGFINNSVKS
ncbi:hypothetical protein [Thiofilum flexile]|uniref:hypothetical protein n=1 Tax=Thiofilum flexile TaxID=125627 RepID=UPI00037B0A2A|nr:hypothetical protein [Thiofilum flexile]